LEGGEDMNVLSLFDGMSCGQIALERVGIKVNNYFASEIKTHAIKVAKHNYPNTIHIGDVRMVERERRLPHINLLIGGSPCQDFSRLKVGVHNTGINGEKSKLFMEWYRVWKAVNPDFFLMENVFMKQDYQDLISEMLGVKPVRINSNLVSFQNRDRLYWTNIPNVTIPEDRGISFQNYKCMDENYCDKFIVNRTPSREKMYYHQCPNVTFRDKVNCLLVKQDRRHNSGLVDYKGFCRYLTTTELEQAQTVPVGYTSCLTKNQSEDVLGDGWTIDVIAHIFKGLKDAPIWEEI
jgi:hypothetical protein